MGNYSSSISLFAAISILSVICGIMVLVAAVMLRVQPKTPIIWAVLIVVFSAISFVGMGGYFIGAVLGIVGGTLALSYKVTKED